MQNAIASDPIAITIIDTGSNLSTAMLTPVASGHTICAYQCLKWYAGRSLGPRSPIDTINTSGSGSTSLSINP